MSLKRTQPILRQACSIVARPTSTSSSRSTTTTTTTLLTHHRRTYATKPPLSSEPLPQPKPIYPPPSNPFQPPPEASPSTSSTQQTATQHSPLKVSIVKALAKLMGYNTRSVTAIRETGNMVGSIVRAVERDHDFWYGECALPPTYQTFFQLHLVYLYLLLPRLRSLPASSSSLTGTSTPLSQTYQTEILTHFFALAENQMRVTLGQGERERVVRNYMKEMGEQWKGAGLGFDYAIAVGQDLPEMGSSAASASASAAGSGEAGQVGGVRGDAELAAWVWRNLFAARYSDLPTDFTPSVNPTPSTTTTTDSTTPQPTSSSATDPSNPIHHLKLPIQLSHIVTFIRRELYRLDQLTDEDVQEGRTGEFGRVKEVVGRKGGEETVDGA